MNKSRILIINTDDDLTALLKEAFKREWYDITFTKTVINALNKIQKEKFDALVLQIREIGDNDSELDDGFKAILSVRIAPLILIMPKADEDIITEYINAGAEDYVTVPFSAKVLIARIRAILRNRLTDYEINRPIKIVDLVIDPPKRKVYTKDKEIDLTCSEFEILELLARNPGIIFSRDKIIEATRTNEYSVGERVIDVQITSLRKKLGPCKRYIQTIRNVGYKMADHAKF